MGTIEQLMMDERAISRTVIQYATGIDMRDWTLYRACFTDPVEIDFSSWSGQPSRAMPVDEWVEGVRGTLNGFAATQHISTNHVIRVNGDQATCVSYMQAQHYLPNNQGDNAYTLGGYYTNTLVRSGDGWKIRKCQLTVTWSTGNRHIFELARQLAGGNEK